MDEGEHPLDSIYGGFVESRQTEHPKVFKRWTDAERRFISAHRSDGYVLISEGLSGFGYDRSPMAVRLFARRCMGLNLRKWPANGMEKCVCCGRWYARPDTNAGREGYCPTCWRKRQTEAMREGSAERAALRDYDRVKHDRKRRKEK